MRPSSRPNRARRLWTEAEPLSGRFGRGPLGHAGEGGQDLSRVSAAIRFAAARFNAHEAAHQAQDVAADKDNAVSWFTYQYQKMFVENIDEHIQLAEKLGKPDA